MNGEKYLEIIFQPMAKTMSRKISTAEKLVSKTKEEIIKEAKRTEEAALYSAKGHFEAAKFWGNFHLMIGVPVVILSTVAGASALSQFDNSKTIAGLLSILVAALTSLITFLNPNEKAGVHQEAGNNYDALQNKVRMFWSIDCWKEKSEDVLTEKLIQFSDNKNKLNLNSPLIPWFAYQAAKRGIERGEAEYKVDKVND